MLSCVSLNDEPVALLDRLNEPYGRLLEKELLNIRKQNRPVRWSDSLPHHSITILS